MVTDTPTTTPATEFVAAFVEGWEVGATDPERFYAMIDPWMGPDTKLIQPLSRTVHGPRGLRQLFDPLFEAVPDLRGETLRYGETADGVAIELRLHGTFGGRPLEWTTLDRIVFRDGLMAERQAFFDPLPLVGSMLMRPRAALKLLPDLLRRR